MFFAVASYTCDCVTVGSRILSKVNLFPWNWSQIALCLDFHHQPHPQGHLPVIVLALGEADHTLVPGIELLGIQGTEPGKLRLIKRKARALLKILDILFCYLNAFCNCFKPAQLVLCLRMGLFWVLKFWRFRASMCRTDIQTFALLGLLSKPKIFNLEGCTL